ncbi:uncharacterized protein BO88DRAFT_69450 [Aspergillus vadensis CBS 113365]|uniref:Uncharacterized protein n=1 Tax=Aspergillus vadensis (strain CBS 113365 / IMI 142717 / IBT 24658) TaxID=1448311 RepID=A0A319B8R8_ASPVC|nr:hypothetical protein BO88DRAFT_69450 [Aspergillus vadensis CBS 113365]PYH68291.1 hypothetical protein BO88DRAFT_69450 [Aspergillus vadensis CBS 113365]
MPTSNGTLLWLAPNRASANFDVDGTQTSCEMTLNPAVPFFGAAPATLDYDNKDQLSGAQNIDGHIGDLNTPIDQYISVFGDGIWMQSL